MAPFPSSKSRRAPRFFTLVLAVVLVSGLPLATETPVAATDTPGDGQSQRTHLLVQGSFQGSEETPRTLETFQDPFDDSPRSSGYEIWDPLEPLNRGIFWFNDKAYLYALEPLARGWRWVVPRFGRVRVQNFFQNLDTPNHVVNSLLQARMDDAGRSFSRLTLNTTVGVVGFFDPASYWISPVNRDFDQTLSKWGVEPGPYLVLPFWGSSSARGAVALGLDSATYPPNYYDGEDAGWARAGLAVTRNVNDVSFRIGEYRDFKRGALDPYAALKNVYEQRIRARRGK